MKNSPPVAAKSGEFAILVTGRSECGENTCERTAERPRYSFPRAGKSFHARHRAEAGVPGKHFVATKAGESNFHPRGPGSFRYEIGVDPVHGWQVHRANGRSYG